MRRTSFFVFCFLFLCASGLSQSTSSESQGMQALVAEVRQLRKDLQATNGYALKAQILLQRLQLQEATVARVLQHLNDERSKLAQTQEHRRVEAARLKQWEENLDNNSEISSEDRKRIQSEISGKKQELEALAAVEQRQQTAEMEAEEQLRTGQAKLGELEDRVDRLETALDNNPH